MFVLIMYLSVGWGTASTGGPVNIGEYYSYQTCDLAGSRIKRQIDKADAYWCVQK